MPGQIASEVVAALSEAGMPVIAKEPVPVRPIEAVNVKQEPGATPITVRDKAVPIFGTGAWWFQKGGPVGVICFLLMGSFWWMGNSQRESTGALIGNMQDQQKVQNEERKQIMSVLLTTQNEISGNMARMARSIERLEMKLDARKD